MIWINFIDVLPHPAHIRNFFNRIFIGQVITKQHRMIFHFSDPCPKNFINSFCSFEFHLRYGLLHSFRSLIQHIHEYSHSIFLCQRETFINIQMPSIRHDKVETASFQIPHDFIRWFHAKESQRQEWFAIYNGTSVFINVTAII